MRDLVRMRAVFPIIASLSALAVLGTWLATCALSWKDAASQQAQEALRLYRQSKFEEALAKITAAQVEMPDSPKLQYNLGNILYKQGRYADARAGYQVSAQQSSAGQASSPIGGLRQSAIYNMGNASFMSGDLNAAIEAYTNALLLDPKDDDARHNLEIALSMQQEQKDQDKNDRSQDKGQKDSDQQKSEQNEQESKEQQAQQQEQQEAAQEPQEQKSQPQQAKPQELTEDQMQQILAALQQQEEQVEKNLSKARAGATAVEKDW